MENLQELTRQESGIVIYDGQEGVLCNWSNTEGYPRIDPFGYSVMGLGEEIPEVEGKHYDELAVFLEDISITNMSSCEVELPISGTVYEVSNNITVIAPDDWN